MLREIKFRAWDKEDKRMFNDVDVLRNGAIIYFELDEYGEEPTNWYNNYGESYEEEHANIFVVMQFTGLTDKNGKEIYEGDILQPSNNEKSFYTVVWNERNGGFKRQYKFIRKYQGEEWEETTLLPIHPDGHKVIGNIYENGDLLRE